MKKLIVFLLCIAPLVASAQEGYSQTGRLINRIDQQVSSTVQVSLTPLNKVNSFDIKMADTVIKFQPNVLSKLHGAISNLTSKTVKIIFNRTHLRLPDSNWTSSVCFGANCFLASVDSLLPQSAFNLEVGIQSEFVLNVFDQEDYKGLDSVVDYIRFTSVGGDPGDTVSFLLKAVVNPPSAVEDNNPKSVSASPKITAIYPSPLVQGNTIKVKVVSPRESSLSYSIYDGIGRVVALGMMRQHIIFGDNTVGISALDGLNNGTYMLKLNFVDGTSDTRFFQVMR